LGFHHYKKAYVLFSKTVLLMLTGFIVFVSAQKISAYYQFEIPNLIYTIWTILIIAIPIGKYSKAMNNEWDRAKVKDKWEHRSKKGRG